ncbi:MAG: NYN domain-containing protein [Thermoanaerobaculia bacterium]
MPYHAHGFVDGAYLRKLAEKFLVPFVDPRTLVSNVVNSPEVQAWGVLPHTRGDVCLTRVVYYDARPEEDGEVEKEFRDYWDAVELLPDTELGFGSLRGGTKRKPPRQKGVDTLLAVDMLVGAFTGIYSVGILVAGDADFVPVVNEVRRRGVMVVVAANEQEVARDLRRAADRFVAIGPGMALKDFPPLDVGGRKWTRHMENA